MYIYIWQFFFVCYFTVSIVSKGTTPPPHVVPTPTILTCQGSEEISNDDDDDDDVAAVAMFVVIVIVVIVIGDCDCDCDFCYCFNCCC